MKTDTEADRERNTHLTQTPELYSQGGKIHNKTFGQNKEKTIVKCSRTQHKFYGHLFEHLRAPLSRRTRAWVCLKWIAISCTWWTIYDSHNKCYGWFCNVGQHAEALGFDGVYFEFFIERSIRFWHHVKGWLRMQTTFQISTPVGQAHAFTRQNGICYLVGVHSDSGASHNTCANRVEQF